MTLWALRWLAIPFLTASAVAGQIASSLINGEVVLTWNGSIVWQGRTTNPLRTASILDDGKEIAAAFDGEKLIWESHPGAAPKVRDKSPDLKATAIPPAGPVAGRGISTSILDGITIIHWQSKEVWRGPTGSFLICKTKALNGAEIAAVFDGEKVIWESHPGAAARVN